eukprot:6370_1
MSEEVIELQYKADRNNNTTNVHNKTQKTKPKAKPFTSQTHSYEHVNEDDIEASLGDIEAGQTSSVTTKPSQSIIPDKIKDTGGYCLLSLYTINFVAILSFMIAAFIRGGKDKHVMMILILICVILTTTLSAYALFKYGRLQDQVNRLKEENRIYDEELISLKETRKTIKHEVNDLENENTKLKTHSNELEDQSMQFTDLVDELKTLSKDGEDITDLVDGINNAFDKMNDLVYQNERTHLLTIYYQSAFRDKNNDMNKEEYQRFLHKVPKKFKERFNSLGNYELLVRKYECVNGEIDLQSFLRMVDDVLAMSDDVLREEFIREYTVQKTLCMSDENSNALRNELIGGYD